MAGSPRPATSLWRWLVAVGACAAEFAATLWAWEALRLPPARPDRVGVALAVAMVISAISGGPLFWWAGRERSCVSPGSQRTSTRNGASFGELTDHSVNSASYDSPESWTQAGSDPGAVSQTRSVHSEHVFISFSPEDSPRVDRLRHALQDAGIAVWRDTSDVWPGEDCHLSARRAITNGAVAFLACFSKASLARQKSYQNEELALAIEQLRLRHPESQWLIPIRFDECDIPDIELGCGRGLASIQRVDLFGDDAVDSIARLVSALLRITGSGTGPVRPPLDRPSPRTFNGCAHKPYSPGRWRCRTSSSRGPCPRP